MILLITIPLSIAISLAWYLPAVKAQGENRVLQTKDYFNIAFNYGFIFTCLLIMVTEITWDAVVKHTPLSGPALDIVSNFFRAALLEEFFKFRGFILAKRKYQSEYNLTVRYGCGFMIAKKKYDLRKIDFILTAGMMGLVYGLFEKVVLGNIGAVIVGLICPMHIMWQFNQGGHYYEYEKAKAAGDQQTARKEWRMAVLVPFFFHGIWDSILDIAGYCLEHPDSTPIQVIGFVLILTAGIGGVIYAVKTVRRACRIAKES